MKLFNHVGLDPIEMSAEMEAAVTYSGSLTITGAITKSTN